MWSQRVFPEEIGGMVLAALEQFEPELATGELLVVEASRSRVRILPL